MAKITTNNSGPYKDQKGYSKVGGLLKSADTKADLESKQSRANQFSPAQNKQVQDQLDIQSGRKKVAMNEHDLPLGDQKKKKYRVGKSGAKF